MLLKIFFRQLEELKLGVSLDYQLLVEMESRSRGVSLLIWLIFHTESLKRLPGGLLIDAPGLSTTNILHHLLEQHN